MTWRTAIFARLCRVRIIELPEDAVLVVTDQSHLMSAAIREKFIQMIRQSQPSAQLVFSHGDLDFTVISRKG